MPHIVVIGCGVIGSTIAYELSQIPDMSITVLDQRTPGSGSTGAALGVLMGAISQKVKGKAWEMRSSSIQRYDQLIPELEAITGRTILYNRQGILKLCFAEDNLGNWQELVAVRQAQGWPLEILDLADLQNDYPQLRCNRITGAVYSPNDRQIDPTALTLALVEAASQRGVRFQFGIGAESFSHMTADGWVTQVETSVESLKADWVVIAAGLGSTPLTQSLMQPIEIRPVLGQAMQIQLNKPLGHSDLQPVITGEDVHIVPLQDGSYWIGATVEFPADSGTPIADEALLQQVVQHAVSFCPDLAAGEIVQTWVGLRPRPEGRPAPVIMPLPGYHNVLLATGHYRNGILLAPATALAIREFILSPI